MYTIPLNNSPNQRFYASVPINGENREFKFNLWYNSIAEYWLISVEDMVSGEKMFDNLPLLVSYGRFEDILCQLKYKQIGLAGVLPKVANFQKSMPDDTNLGTGYILIWGNN